MADESTVTVTGQVRLADLYRFSAATTFWRFRRHLAVVGVFFSIIAITIAIGALRGRREWLDIVKALSPLVVVPYIFGAGPYFTARKQIKDPSFRVPMTYTFSERGIDYSCARGQAHVNWGSVIEGRETSTQFIFFLQPRLAHLVPKHFFKNADELSAVRTLVKTNVEITRVQG